jgi:hypothetical protein
MRRRIVILMQENARFGRLGRWLDRPNYFVAQLARHWRGEGIEVRYLYDPARPMPGDLLFVHVDLSVVPEACIELAKSYPAAVNAKVRDIRKSVISRQIVRPDDDWDGPVIVKSDLNHAGFPEGRFSAARRPASLAMIGSPGDYPVYPHRREVPAAYFDDPDLVVERFLPERIGGRYCVRSYTFLGDREDTFILYSSHPAVKMGSVTGVEFTEVHPDIRKRRQAMGFDYGKFDYVVRDGQAILFDANKTPGRLPVRDADTAARVRRRAAGIHALFA